MLKANEREERADVKRILVATDGSAGGTAAVDAAIDLAHETGALVTVVCVRHIPALLGTPNYQRVVSNELRGGRAVIAEARERATRAGVEVESEILTGHAPDQIVELARLRDADVIVVGSHGRGRLATALLGSVANAVVHTADRPVLIVRKPAEEYRKAA
jgi:nucleotide-binding universal stress UspA family protein